MNTGSQKQELHDIMKTYYKMLYSEKPLKASGETYLPNFDVFYKTSKQKLVTLLAPFDISINDFMSARKYYFNDSENEIIDMLNLFDAKIVKSIRLKKQINFSDFLFDKDVNQYFEDARKFSNALNSFMQKNGIKPSYIDDIQDQLNENEVELTLYDNMEKQIKYLQNNSVFAPFVNSQILDIIIILQEILSYVAETSFNEAEDILNNQWASDGLKTLEEELILVRNRYKRHFDIIYNGEYYKYPKFRYKSTSDGELYDE